MSPCAHVCVLQQGMSQPSFTIILSAPYMVKAASRFVPILKHFGVDVIIPAVEERLEEADLLQYAGRMDGVICGDDRYTARVLEACCPRLKVIAKWGTGLDSIDVVKASSLGVKVQRYGVCFVDGAVTFSVAY
jgi:D-3-phosphoglycerate dehydrogenase